MTECTWTCTTCGTERGRPDMWMDDHRPEGSRVMYCVGCDAPEWHKPPRKHRVEYTAA